MGADAFQSMAMIRHDAVIRSARNAVLIAALITIGTFISSALRAIRKRSSAPTAHEWLSTILPMCILFVVVFTIYFALNLWRVSKAQQIEEIVDQETPKSELLKSPLYGFVTMEFYWLILNRTFVVFVAREGLYGWKAAGPVTNANRRYFEPLQQMVEDKELMRDLPAIRKLAGVGGGFFLGQSDLASVTSDDRSQWGMGGIPHSGHVRLQFSSGKSRKFILLGTVIPEEVRDCIVTTLRLG
jgi:hypothetical protein